MSGGGDDGKKRRGLKASTPISERAEAFAAGQARGRAQVYERLVGLGQERLAAALVAYFDDGAPPGVRDEDVANARAALARVAKGAAGDDA